MKTMHRGQMSESFLTAVFLSLSGGLQDAYTYLFRGKVFANAQTGNIVLLSAHIMDGQWGMVLHYFIPLCAFAFGVLVAERMRERFRSMQRLHWRQLVVLGEMLLLLIVGFLPESCNLLANAIVSFSCAMQVQAFRKVDGYAFASTMCIGDLRSGVEAFCIWSKTHEPHAKDRMLRYFGIILLFALGAHRQRQCRAHRRTCHLDFVPAAAGSLCTDVHPRGSGAESAHRKGHQRNPQGNGGNRPDAQAGAERGAAGTEGKRGSQTII